MTATNQDRRVRRTRTAIQRALVELMLEKGYDGVTVSEIIERADVGRSTFYAHFSDKQQVLYDHLDELAAVLRSHRDAAAGQLFGFSLPMFAHAYEQGPLLRALLGRRGGTVVLARFERLLSEMMHEELTALVPPGRTPAIPLPLVVAAAVGAYMGLLTRWLDQDDRPTPHQLDAAFRALVTQGITATLGIDAARDDGAVATRRRARPGGRP